VCVFPIGMRVISGEGYRAQSLLKCPFFHGLFCKDFVLSKIRGVFLERLFLCLLDLIILRVTEYFFCWFLRFIYFDVLEDLAAALLIPICVIIDVISCVLG